MVIDPICYKVLFIYPLILPISWRRHVLKKERQEKKKEEKRIISACPKEMRPIAGRDAKRPFQVLA
jgi:hypothetical protein